jgi:Domain of unknown function (DUF4192)
VGPPRGRIDLAFRYDLPDPPDPGQASDIAAHATSVLRRRKLDTAIAAGYGPGTLVTPVADALMTALLRSGVRVRELLRVEGGRYWSYVCHDPGCCSPDGVAFDLQANQAAAAMTVAGLVALPDRAALAGTVAPVTGAAAQAMERATRRAEARAGVLLGQAEAGPGGGRQLLLDVGRHAVQNAIAAYRDGKRITSDAEIAWLSAVLALLPVRDDAWARMDPDPELRAAHQRLWTDVTRRAAPAYRAAPAALLAFTAWQSGDGALANIALDLALDAHPGYSLALLLRGILDAGVPPSAARPPMTPEEVADGYRAAADDEPGSPGAR